MQTLDDLQAFDINNASVILWIFKKSYRDGQDHYTGRWISLTAELSSQIKFTATQTIESRTELLSYDLLAQNNEQSFLAIERDETYASEIIEKSAAELPGKRIKKLKELENAAFYVVKFYGGQGTLYCAKKVDNSWQTRKQNGLMSVIFSEDVLDLNERPSFNISRDFDFLIFRDTLFISHKRNFESVLSHRAEYLESFSTLKADPDFSRLFSNLGHIASYVGTNRMHLRRAYMIWEKGHFRDANFIRNLRTHAPRLNLAIEFDEQSRIVTTAENCRDIFQALLDHRLNSLLSEKVYDVPNATSI